MNYQITWEEKGVKVVLIDVFADAELRAFNIEIYADPRSLHLRYQLLDFTAVEHFPISTDAIRHAAAIDKAQAERNPDVKIAIIANNIVMKGLANMYAAYVGPSSWETAFFENEADARKWFEEDH